MLIFITFVATIRTTRQIKRTDIFLQFTNTFGEFMEQREKLSELATPPLQRGHTAQPVAPATLALPAGANAAGQPGATDPQNQAARQPQDQTTRAQQDQAAREQQEEAAPLAHLQGKAREFFGRFYAFQFSEYYAYKAGMLERVIFALWMKSRWKEFHPPRNRAASDVLGVTFRDGWTHWLGHVHHNAHGRFHEAHERYSDVRRQIRRSGPREKSTDHRFSGCAGFCFSQF